MQEPEEYIYELPQDNIKISQAPLSRRAIAFVIDLIIFNLIFYTPYITVFQLTSGISDELLEINYLMAHQELFTAVLTAVVCSLFILLIYLSLSEHLLGRTFGKQLIGLSVSGTKSLNACLLRNLTKSVLIFLLPLDLLGFLSKSNDRLTSIAAKTKVLYEYRLSLVSDLI